MILCEDILYHCSFVIWIDGIFVFVEIYQMFLIFSGNWKVCVKKGGGVNRGNSWNSESSNGAKRKQINITQAYQFNLHDASAGHLKDTKKQIIPYLLPPQKIVIHYIMLSHL